MNKGNIFRALRCLSTVYDDALAEVITLLTFVVDACWRLQPGKPIRIECVVADAAFGLRRRYRVLVEEIVDDAPLVNFPKGRVPP